MNRFQDSTGGAAVTCHIGDGIALVTINRPDAMNALSPEVIVRLAATWRSLQGDDDVRVVLITGAGDKAFCAGADLKLLVPLVNGDRPPHSDWDDSVLRDPSLLDVALLKTFDMERPVIAAINGHAIGGGFEMIQATDLRVMSSEAKIGLQEVKWGLFPAGGSTVNLPRQIAKAVAMELLLTGELLSADRALQLGLVNHIAPHSDVLASAYRLAHAVAKNSPLAVRAIRRSARIVEGLPTEKALKIEAEISKPIFYSDDAREGLAAFAEHRIPDFSRSRL